jgi:hypothetical protein
MGAESDFQNLMNKNKSHDKNQGLETTGIHAKYHSDYHQILY